MAASQGTGPSTSSGLSAEEPITLTASGGARAVVLPQGAQVVSWTPADGEERLFLSQHPSGGPGGLRGGVPVIFPQFGGFGSLPFHGFARGLLWDLVAAASHPDDGRPHGPGDGEAMAEFALRDSEATRAVWPHAFRATLAVHAGGPRLRVALGVTNTGAQPFSFTAALHTYIRVADLAQTTLEALPRPRAFAHKTAASCSRSCIVCYGTAGASQSATSSATSTCLTAYAMIPNCGRVALPALFATITCSGGLLMQAFPG